MRVIKLGSSYNNLVKLWPCQLQTLHLRKMKVQDFCLGSCSWFSQDSTIVKENVDAVLFSGLEHLSKISSISKKNNQLSQFEKDLETLKRLKKGDIYYPYEGQVDRFKHFIANKSKLLFNKTVMKVSGVKLGKVEETSIDRYSDILIVGGGMVGLSIAFALKSRFPHGPCITVVDKDSTFPRASTNLSQGIITQQLFTTEEEIEILKYGVEFFSTFTRSTEIEGKAEFKLPYDPLGTLVLGDHSNGEELLKRHDRMKYHNIPNKILDCNTLKKKFPWLNLDGVLFGSLGMLHEGTVDPWSYQAGLKCKALSLGVNFVTAEVIEFGFTDNDIRRVICKLPDGTYDFLEFAYCVLAGGIESLNLVKVLNKLDEIIFQLKLPLEERMRYEYCIYSRDGPGLNTPMVIDSDGTYFRRIGLTGHYVAGVPDAKDDENNPYEIFQTKIKPFLMKRIPGFQKVHLVGGWVDTYDFCISNGVGITGPHPDTYRIIFALGFSHLGLQYLPALARAIMEYIIYDEYQTIDFKPFHIENLWRKQHLGAEKKKKELLESKGRVALPN